MFWLALAAQLSGPVPLKPLLGPDDVPTRLVEPNVLQRVGIALTVTPNGKIQGCAVEKSSGNSKLDSYTCEVAARRAKFKPPTHIDGAAAYLIYRADINWWLGDGYPPSTQPGGDLYLTVTALPPKVASPAIVRLMLEVGADGSLSNCAAEDSKYDLALVKTGCEQLLLTYRPTPARAADGAAVASVQSATVVFQTN